MPTVVSSGRPIQLPKHVASATFSTADVEAGQALEYWRSLYDGFVDIDVAPESQREFWARSESWRLGPFTVIDAEGGAKRFFRTAAHCARSDGDYWVFRMSSTVAWMAAHRDRSERIAPGDLWLARSVRPSVVAAPAGRYRLLMLPAEACPDLTIGLSRLRPGQLAGPGALLLSDMLSALPDRLRRSSPGVADQLADRLRLVVAACLFGERSPEPSAEGLGAGAVITQRDRVLSVIRDNIGSAMLGVNRISRLTGVSRSVLYRMFESEGGVAACVRDMRLQLVMEDLTRAGARHLSIRTIAERHGLHNASSFSRAFKQKFGVPPRDARDGR